MNAHVVKFFPQPGRGFFRVLPPLPNSKGESLSWVLNTRGGTFCDFRPKSPFISETAGR